MMSTSPKTESSSQNVALSAAVLELLASRICHDLISPVGAVHNGIEFLEEMGVEAGEEAVSLIAHSAQQATAKLQAFRFAYGAGGRDPNIGPKDVHSCFSELIEADKKIDLNWDPCADLGYDNPPTGFCKLLMGTLMLAQECMPKGGIITVQPAPQPGTTHIIAQGENTSPRPSYEEALSRELAFDSLDPRLVHPYAMSLLAESYNFVIRFEEQENGRVVIALAQNA